MFLHNSEKMLVPLILAHVVPLLAAHVSAEDHHKREAPRCKAVPGAHEWPSEEQWQALNASLGGQLIRPTPPGAVCHPDQPSYNAERCAAVQTGGWQGFALHVNDPVSMMSNTWTNDSCLPDPSLPCSGSGYPVYVVNASAVEHVQLGVKFAKKHNIRLVVKATGHDYVGRSVAPNSLSIWTHHLTGMQHHFAGSFKPKCCSKDGAVHSGSAITVKAASRMQQVHEFASRFDEAVVGGSGSTVGVGGYLTGGGHSLLSTEYGLAADQVLELEIVTPTGDIKVLNECNNKELFWAMRGIRVVKGGGSTFGIITSATLKTYPSPQISSLTVALLQNPALLDDQTAIWDLVAYILSEMPRLSKAGVSGYLYPVVNLTVPGFGVDGPITGFFGVLTIPGGNNGSVAIPWQPIDAYIQANWPGLFLSANQMGHYSSFWDWIQVHFDSNPVGDNGLAGSWLLDEQALTGSREKLKDAFQRFAVRGWATLHLVAGKGVRDGELRGGGNAVLPAWRRAYLHATCGIGFPPLNATAKAEAIKAVDQSVAALRELAPDMGAYMNEANAYEPNFQRAFWGSNYDRLKTIKRDVDPDDVFWCHPCVGNERWKEVDGKLCRV
ncbi:hypothetical protein PoMZ_12891 [Pyricularia oryzae]|uniref:FAD-binding PCMH-type domain-containing protein n=1 Tax=Pyricularia oryzae TaxID=318829 RepID=A0A4P7NTR0_PYROR|nr:hypothetical protein PoMZ_12891 [Pyricularia oryzae]